MKNLKKTILLATISAQLLVYTRAQAFVFPLCLSVNLTEPESHGSDAISCARAGARYGAVFGAALGLLTLNPGFVAVGAAVGFMDSDGNLATYATELVKKYPEMSRGDAESIAALVLNSFNRAQHERQSSVTIHAEEYINAAPDFFANENNKVQFFGSITDKE